MTTTAAHGRAHAAHQPKRVVRLIAGREVRTRLRNKAFVYSTAGTLVLLLGVMFLPRLMGGDEGAPKVAVAGMNANDLRAPDAAPGAAAEDLQVRSTTDENQARRLVQDGEADAAVVATGAGTKLFVTNRAGDEVQRNVIRALQTAATSAELRRQDVELDRVRSAADKGAPEVVFVKGDENSGQRTMVAFVVSLILFFQVFTYGIAVAIGVVEEKSSRVVELLLVPPIPGSCSAGRCSVSGWSGCCSWCCSRWWGSCSRSPRTW